MKLLNKFHVWTSLSMNLRMLYVERDLLSSTSNLNLRTPRRFRWITYVKRHRRSGCRTSILLIFVFHVWVNTHHNSHVLSGFVLFYSQLIHISIRFKIPDFWWFCESIGLWSFCHVWPAWQRSWGFQLPVWCHLELKVVSLTKQNCSYTNMHFRGGMSATTLTVSEELVW